MGRVPERPRQPTRTGNRKRTNSREPTAFCWRAGPPQVSSRGAVRTRVRRSRDDAHRDFDRPRRDPRSRQVRARLLTLQCVDSDLLPVSDELTQTLVFVPTPKGKRVLRQRATWRQNHFSKSTDWEKSDFGSHEELSSFYVEALSCACFGFFCSVPFHVGTPCFGTQRDTPLCAAHWRGGRLRKLPPGARLWRAKYFWLI